MGQQTTSEVPELSVVVAQVSGRGEHLQDCLTALKQQVDPPPMEVIVACDTRIGDVSRFQAVFPTVRFLLAEPASKGAGSGWTREHHDVLRAIGLRHARGKIVALIQDDCQPEVNWCKIHVREHEAPHGAIGGAVENGTDRLLNWAIYFCDFERYQNPVPRGPVPNLSDCNVSYKREALAKVADVWADTFQEIVVNSALLARGEVLWMSPDLVVRQKREIGKFRAIIQERYVWGRSFAGKRAARAGRGARILYATFAFLLPLLLLGRMFANAFRKRRRLRIFMRAFPLIVVLTVVWSWGEFVGYATRRPVSSRRGG